MIPFPNHNQSPRNTYQSVGKQAVGIYMTNYNKLKRIGHVGSYIILSIKPICNMRGKLLPSNEVPDGAQNIVGDIASACGRNQEDSMVLVREV